MKKCLVCTLGSWTVGLAALAWAMVGLLGLALPAGPWFAIVTAIVGITAIGFLIYQPPFKACPRCEAATLEHLKQHLHN